MRCGDCKFFGSTTDKGQRWRQCTAVIHDERAATGDDVIADDKLEWSFLDDDEKNDIRAARQRKAMVVDGSGYYAALRVQEDFGCVLFVSK